MEDGQAPFDANSRTESFFGLERSGTLCTRDRWAPCSIAPILFPGPLSCAQFQGQTLYGYAGPALLPRGFDASARLEMGKSFLHVRRFSG